MFQGSKLGSMYRGFIEQIGKEFDFSISEDVKKVSEDVKKASEDVKHVPSLFISLHRVGSGAIFCLFFLWLHRLKTADFFVRFYLYKKNS